MSPTTTLITFRVRAPRSTRSLLLYGSWDNFSIGYSMIKDLQLGSEYWSGCFNFTNIICDGRPSDVMRSRDGGLKMGGTYWYHYKVDDETDFHNVCERATTNCPMLPGQLVNVLNVPVALSGNRSRDPSTSSTSSERRTMNPEDKFMNPRPAPAKPESLRLNTSPTLSDFPGNNDASRPSSPSQETPNTSRFLRLPRKRSVDGHTSPSSGTALTGGLRAAFRLRTARSQSPESQMNNGTLNDRRAVSAERQASSPNGDTHSERLQRPQRGLLLRAKSDETVSTLSFIKHREQRSTSKKHVYPCETVPIETPRHIRALNLSQSNHEASSGVKDVTSIPDAHVDRLAEDVLVRTELDLEKRLPTLPNTPSSAYPMSIIGDSLPCHQPLDMDQLNSHFSATTVDTQMHPTSRALNERSHFSAWTTTSDTSSIFVDTSEPVPSLDRNGYLGGGRPRLDHAVEELFLPASFSYSSMTSSTSTTPSSVCGNMDTESADHEEAAPSARFSHVAALPNQIQHYSLPDYGYQSQNTLKSPSRKSPEGFSGSATISDIEHQTTINGHGNEIIHSESMQRLLDELSYLGGMIRQ